MVLRVKKGWLKKREGEEFYIMNQIFFIFLLFSLLFIIESKAINILFAFVGIMITLAIQLGFHNNLSEINGEYFAYIIILVQVSALTILFGFIIMLYPKLSFTIPNSYFSNSFLFRYLRIFSLVLIGSGLVYYLEPLSNLNFTVLNFTSSEWSDTILIDDTELLRKLGTSLYSEDNNILKLIVLTIILLLAIIILFFLVST
jgi:hypothetical protein